MLNKLKSIKIFKTILTNFKYHKQIKNDKKYILVEGKIHTKIDKKSKIYLNGNLRLGTDSRGSKRETILVLEKNAVLNVNNSRFCYGNDIKIFEGAEFTIGDSFINSDSKIRCQNSITIGDKCAIGTNVIIMDSDFHSLNGKIKNEKIVIENHVWVGTRVTILSGVKIGEGAVIAANSLVNKDVPPHALVGGVPAKILKENVVWGNEK